MERRESTSLQNVSWAAARLGVGLQRAYGLIRQGVLPTGVIVRLGGTLMINPEKLDAWIADGGCGLPADAPHRGRPRRAAG